MVTRVLITIDTELSAGRQRQGVSLSDNFASSFLGAAGGDTFGVPWLMARMSARGITGVFFVDPMPALVYGQDVVTRMVEPILEGGHEVQLHLHTEWLAFATASLVQGRQGRNIGDFSEADQKVLIGWARDALTAAGAPKPDAFRAGNYGASPATLRALSALGIRWDSSFNADYLGRDCQLDFPSALSAPLERDGVIELPIAGIWDRPDHFRPAQVCAQSGAEMRAGLAYAANQNAHSFVVVSHSFEMLSRDRLRPNRQVMTRFEAMCDAIASDPRLHGGGFRDLSPPPAASPALGRAGPSLARTMSRHVQQAYGHWRYERARRSS